MDTPPDLRVSPADPDEVPTGPVRTAVAVQLYFLTCYAVALLPLAWGSRPTPPTWIWIVPAWLFGLPGYFIGVLGPVIAVPLALVGLTVLVANRARLRLPLLTWCITTAVLTTAWAIITITPLGQHLSGLIAD